MGLEHFVTETEDEEEEEDEQKNEVPEEAIQWKEIDVSELELYYMNKGRGDTKILEAVELDSAIATVFKTEVVEDLIDRGEIPTIEPENEDDDELREALSELQEEESEDGSE